MTEWIKVEDRLPPKAGRYLVFQVMPTHMHNCLAYNYPYPCCEVNVAYFKGFQGSDWNWSSSERSECNPTHWMRLPEKPNE